MFPIRYEVRCIWRTFSYNYRQNNSGDNPINTWSSALILTRMDKSLLHGLPTSNLAQPSEIRSLWDLCEVWISLAWQLGRVLHSFSGSRYGQQKSHKMEETARHDGMLLIFLRTSWWKFMLGCYWVASRQQSTREVNMVHKSGHRAAWLHAFANRKGGCHKYAACAYLQAPPSGCYPWWS